MGGGAVEVSGVVLAAGGGTRMGQPKLLLSLEGKPLLGWVLELVERLPLAERILVLGAHADLLIPTFFQLSTSLSLITHHPSPITVSRPNGQPWLVVYNARWSEGMSTSLQAAARVARYGLLVFLGDMPWVPEEGARAVLAHGGSRPVALSYRGQRGFPVYLPASLRLEIMKLSGDRGARDLLEGCLMVEWDHPGVVRDVDTPADLTDPPSPITDHSYVRTDR